MNERPNQHLLHPALFLALLVGLCLWVLSLPSFPTQDGPMHVYYAHVLAGLLQGDSFFARGFFIRHYLPPYSLFYYFLIALARIAPTFLAERLVVCTVICVQAFGFRALARAVGPGGDLASLWLFPLLLNWPLGMGFMNFELSLGMGFFALALWWRMRDRVQAAPALGFLMILIVMTVTHPVPLLLVLVVAWTELAASAARSRLLDTHWRYLRRHLPRLALLCLASTSILYVARFTDHHRVSQAFTVGAASLTRLVKLRSLSYLAGDRWTVVLYRAGLYVMLLGCLAIGIRAERLQPQDPREGNLWLWLVPISAVLVLLIPSDMNGSHYFSDRLVLLVWISALLATCVPQKPFAPVTQHSLALAAVAFTAFIVVIVDVRIRPVARLITEAQSKSFPEPPGTPGILLGSGSDPLRLAAARGLSFDPFLWEAAYTVTRSGTVLLNPPWLDLPIMQLGTRPGMLNQVYGPAVMDSPRTLLETLAPLPAPQRELTLSAARFLLLEDPAAARQLQLEPTWDCRSFPPFKLCIRP